MDRFYNHDVAEWISKSMSGMDPDEAEMFARFFVYEVHKQDIENNRRTIDRHVEEVSKSLMDDLKPPVRELISKALGDLKVDPDIAYDKKTGKAQPRNAKGRWSKIEVGGTALKIERQRGYDRDGFRLPPREIDVTGALNRTGEASTSFANRWTETGDRDHSTNERTYRRVAAGAELLGNIPNEHAQVASAVGQFAGQFGPEAEKVIGPAARRTAYRYRGTERAADPKLGSMNETAQHQVLKTSFSDQELNSASPPKLTPEMRMAAAELAATHYLYKKLPSKKLSELQTSSGKIPPSQGVIINSDGEIVAQAVGYNEDHYLPFNLKNLKGLQGGSYVRTRSSGGLTSEDIYTGLISGARSVTVVSRSGVFTLDFDDHLRGGRRYSDKAGQMVGRYAQTLDAVGSGKVAQRKLSPAERAEIREETEREMEAQGYNKTEIEAKIKTKEQEFSANPRLTKAEIQDLEDQAVKLATEYDPMSAAPGSEKYRMPSDPKMRYKAYYSELYDNAMEEKAKRMYQLDADGYEAAMHALQEQFPYFIQNVDVKKLPTGGAERDAGYVRPNYIRPKAVKAGYYDPQIQGFENKQKEFQGTGKFSAAELGYQNWRTTSKDVVDAETAEGTEAAAAATGPKSLRGRDARNRVLLEDRRDAGLKDLAEAAKVHYEGMTPNVKAQLPMLARYKRDPDMSTYTEAQKETLYDELEMMTGLIEGSSDPYWKQQSAKLQDLMQAAKRANNALKAQTPFDKSTWTPDTVSKTPQRWDESAAHSPNAEHPEVYGQEWSRAVNDHKLKDEVEITDDDLTLQLKQGKWQKVNKLASELKTDPKNASAWNQLETALVRVGWEEGPIRDLGNSLPANTDGVNKLEEESKKKSLGYIRLRSVKSAAGDNLAAPTTSEAAPATAPAPEPPGGSPPVPSQAPAASAAGAARPVSANRTAVPVANAGPTTHEDVLSFIDNQLSEGGLQGDELAAFKQVHTAFQGDNQYEQQAAIESLSTVRPHYATILRRRLNEVEPTHAAQTQLPKGHFTLLARHITNYASQSDLSAAQKAHLSDIAHFIENQDIDNANALFDELTDEAYDEFQAEFATDFDILTQSREP